MRILIASFLMVLLTNPTRADLTSVGADGANALVTGLNGLGTVIGMVDFARPGKPGFDDAQYVHNQVIPTQVYASFQESMSNPRFGGEHERHEVMKALLLNSADKLSGVHGSNRNVVTKPDDGETNWLLSDAYSSPFVSLDERMGAGHLNVESALENYKPGKYGPSAAGQPSTYVPPIGWDYGSVGLFGSNDYIFNQNAGGGYVAITLAWDRTVESTSGDDNYSSGDQFFNPSLNNLDVYLMPADSIDIGDAIRASTTDTDNLEHIFYAVPFGEYKIRVTNFGGGPEDAQDYGLAWWQAKHRHPVTSTATRASTAAISSLGNAANRQIS